MSDDYLIESPLLRKGLKLILRPWAHEVSPRRFKKRCEVGKIRWVTERDAKIAVQRLGNTGAYYQCKKCGHWHVTRGGARV